MTTARSYPTKAKIDLAIERMRHHGLSVGRIDYCPNGVVSIWTVEASKAPATSGDAYEKWKERG